MESEQSKISSGVKPNDQFGHYKIISRIGKGGMGEVFLAKDNTLDRNVALKFLNEKFSHDTDKLNRFIQEAKAASALNHPNILTVFEIGETDGAKYMAAEFIDGQTLRNLIENKELIPLNTILKISVQIAEALSAAHEANIIHRDIKPDNIMIRRDGYVKVLDFGLAKLSEAKTEEVESEGDTKIQLKTDTGMVMGTALYMSPEQARGQKVDTRTDIFSLGVLLYEMITGRAPFEGETLTDLFVAILEKEPVPVTRYAPETPTDLQHIIGKTLRKNKDERYQTMKSLLADLKTLKEELEFAEKLERAESPAAASNISDQAKKTVETDKTKPEERTIPPTSTTEYIVNQVKSHKLGAILTLAVLLIGVVAVSYYLVSNTGKASVLTDRDVILITDFENKTGEEIFDGTLKQGLTMALQQSPFLSIFPDARVQETLKLMKRAPEERITKELGREISRRTGLKAFITGTLTKLGSAYVLVLEVINAQSGETIAFVQTQADANDQKNVLDAVSQAATELRGKLGESLRQIEKFDKPLADVTTSSLESLKAYAMGWESLGSDNAGSIQHFKRAIDIDPNFASAYLYLSFAYWNTAQFELAGDAAKKAFDLREGSSEREQLEVEYVYYSIVTNELDKSINVLKLLKTTFPRSSTNDLGLEYREIGEHEKALTEALIAVEREPDRSFSYSGLANTYILLNRYPEAKETVEKAFQKNFDDAAFRAMLYQIAFIRNDEKEMQRQIEAMTGNPGEDDVPRWQASVASFRGQGNKSEELYRQAVTIAERDNNKELQSLRLSEGALTASVFGKCSRIRTLTEESLGLARNRYTISSVALALARCGDISKANYLLNELEEKYPKATLGNGLLVPTIKAMIEINKGKAKGAIELLETAKRYERSIIAGFWPQYLRGEAYLELNDSENAKAEFQKILDNRGLGVASPLYPLAQLGKARSMKDKKEYEKFFEMWKSADKDLPALVAAKKEFAELE